MTGLSVNVLSHVVRRGLSTYPGNAVEFEFVDAAEPAGNRHGEPNFLALFGAAAVLIITFLLTASIEYTIEDLMVTLAMIESDSTTELIASPSVSKKHDAAKESLLHLDNEDDEKDDEADVEFVTTKYKPVTTSIRGTIKHLHQIGGFRARWRGLGQAILYLVAHVFVGQAIGLLLFGSRQELLANFVGGMIAKVLLCRLHMLWTHAMIAMPSNKPWYRRFVARKNSRVVLLPAFVSALPVEALLVVPFLLLVSLNQGFSGIQTPAVVVISIAAGIATSLLCLFYVVIPVSATLVRVEACLLPEDEQTIVPFDRDEILGSLDICSKGAPGKLFAAAWKSFSSAARFRIIKIYIKLFMVTFGLWFFGIALSMGILWMSGQLWVLAQMFEPTF